MKILIDNGHGNNTRGKCSPDYQLLEWAWTREIAARVVCQLKAEGYDADLLTPEMQDVTLRERVRRVNYHCDRLGARNVLLISIHNNAAGADGRWHDAKGWSAFVSEYAPMKVSTRSAALSDALVKEAEKSGRKVRRQHPNKSYWVQSLAMTRDSKCAAVLTENFFMDNRDDCQYLLSEEGKRECVRIHVDGIKNYIKYL